MRWQIKPHNALFIAISIDSANKLTQFTNKLQNIAPYPAVKWVNPEQYHLTLKFLGDTHEKHIPVIKECLSRISYNHQQFTFTIEKTGTFTDKQGFIKIIWAGIQPVKPFIEINKDINNKLEKSGLSFSHKKFKAHLTLGRVKNLSNPDYLNVMLSNYTNTIFAKQKAVDFKLIESKLTSSSPEYNTIETFKLK